MWLTETACDVLVRSTSIKHMKHKLIFSLLNFVYRVYTETKQTESECTQSNDVLDGRDSIIF